MMSILTPNSLLQVLQLWFWSYYFFLLWSFNRKLLPLKQTPLSIPQLIRLYLSWYARLHSVQYSAHDTPSKCLSKEWKNWMLGNLTIVSLLVGYPSQVLQIKGTWSILVQFFCPCTHYSFKNDKYLLGKSNVLGTRDKAMNKIDIVSIFIEFALQWKVMERLID